MSKPVAALTQFQTNFPFANLVSLDSNFSSLLAATNDALTYSNYVIDTSGVANTLNASFAAGITATLTAGLQVQIKIANTNTGSTSLNLNALGLIPIINPDGSAMSPGQLLAGGIYILQYNGSNFILLGSWVSPALVRTAAEIAAGITPVNYAYPELHAWRYGADPTNTNDSTAAINNAMIVAAAVSGVNGGSVHLPRGNYKTTATLNRPANVYLVGDGPEATAITATGNYAIIASTGSSSNIINRGGVQNLCLNGTWGANHANTGSIGVSESFTNRAIHRDLRFHGCFQGMYGIGLWQVDWYNLQADGAGTQQNSVGFYLDQLVNTLPVGTSNAVNAVNCTCQGIADTGFRLLNPNGSKFIDCEAENGVNGFWIGTTAAGCYPIEFGQFTGCVSDTNSGIGFLVQQGSNASPVIYLQFANCWAGTHGNLGVYFDGCQGLNWSNGIVGNNSGAGMRLNNSTNCVVSTTQFIGDNTANTAGIGDIIISGGSFNKIIGNFSNMANATSVSLLESAGTNSNTIEHNTFLQSATLIGPNTRALYNQGYNPVGISGPIVVGASPATITAGQSPETHYLTQSATFTGTVTKGGGRAIGTMTSGTTVVVQLDPGGSYQVTWTTTAPTYTRDIH